jgi:N-methylhydantoinase B/oxoprolinase/acetone carboxylase alpha subunit
MKSAIEQFRASLPFTFNLAAKAAVVSNEGRVLSVSGGCAPSMARSIAAARDFFGERWQAGDVSISNDPDRGATHVCQLTAVAPLYRQDQVIAWGALRSNVVDLGGWCPGGYSPQAIDRWAEAARFEPAKLLLGGKVRREVADILSLNSRTPKATRRVALSLAESVLRLDPRASNSHGADLARARAALDALGAKEGHGNAPITVPAGMTSPGEIAVRLIAGKGRLKLEATAPAASSHPINLGEAASRDIVLAAVSAMLGLQTLQSGALLELVDVQLGGLLAARVPSCVGIGRETSGAALYAACAKAAAGIAGRTASGDSTWLNEELAGEIDWTTGQLSAKSAAALLAAESQVKA